MKNVMLTFFLFFTVFAQAQQKASLKKVTVYPRGAVLEHAARVNLKKGTQTVVLRGIASDIDISSLMIEIDGYVNVLSHKYLREFKTGARKPDVTIEQKTMLMQKQVERMQKEVKSIQQQIAIENKTIDIILTHPKSSGETHMNVNALSGYVALYKDQAYKSQLKVSQLTEKQEILNDSINKLNEKMEALAEDPVYKIIEADSVKNAGYLELQLNAQSDVVSQINFTYFSNNASWKASYDVLGESVDKPLTIKYKANIFQSTGLDWNNVKISVSTSQPNRSNNQPMLSAWYLDVYKGYQLSGEGLYNQIGVTNSIPSFSYNSTPVFEFNMMEQTGINISFDSDMRYSIPSDNQQYIVSLKTIEVPCTYKYYAVPKLDKDVFLLAEIADFEQYNFLPGEAQVFLGGKFTGKTLLDPLVTTDGINISMGRDQNIVVKRERVKLEEKTKFLEGNKIDHFKYNIFVKNNSVKEITIIVKDQYPLTVNKDISVQDKEHTGGGVLNDANGVVTWIETIKPTKSKEMSLTYKVSRPKDMVIAGL